MRDSPSLGLVSTSCPLPLTAVVGASFERNVADGWSTADRGEARRLMAKCDVQRESVNIMKCEHVKCEHYDITWLCVDM